MYLKRLDEFEKVERRLLLKKAQQNRERERMEAEIRVRIEEGERREILKGGNLEVQGQIFSWLTAHSNTYFLKLFDHN